MTLLLLFSLSARAVNLYARVVCILPGGQHMLCKRCHGFTSGFFVVTSTAGSLTASFKSAALKRFGLLGTILRLWPVGDLPWFMTPSFHDWSFSSYLQIYLRSKDGSHLRDGDNKTTESTNGLYRLCLYPKKKNKRPTSSFSFLLEKIFLFSLSLLLVMVRTVVAGPCQAAYQNLVKDVFVATE